MTDRPIIFSAPMVRALLEGRKSQTRRVLSRQPYEFRGEWWITDRVSGDCTLIDWVSGSIGLGPNYAIGDRLYVREACATWGRGPGPEPVEFPVVYAADDTEWEGIKHDAKASKGNEWKVRPSIHMPRWSSRLTLIVTDVRVQRLQEISEADAWAEGADGRPWDNGGVDHIVPFRDLWNSLYGPDAWAANPWVCALTFNVIRANIDSPEAAQC